MASDLALAQSSQRFVGRLFSPICRFLDDLERAGAAGCRRTGGHRRCAPAPASSSPASGYPSVVSDVDRDDLVAAMAHHGLAFSAVVTSEDAGAYKPARAMFTRALAALALDAKDVLHIG